jgi:hypothetical protein
VLSEIFKTEQFEVYQKVTMAKHPEHLRSVIGVVRNRLDEYIADANNTGPCELYNGPVRALCPLAPNNVNTLACAALVGPGWKKRKKKIAIEKKTKRF